MAKPRKLQKKNPKVVWRGDGIEAVYQLLGNEGDAGVVINSARDAMASAVRYGDGEDTDAFIRALAKIEKMTDPQKAVDAINKAFEDYDLKVGGGCGSSPIELRVSIESRIPDGYTHEDPFEAESVQAERLSLTQYARLVLKEGKALETWDDAAMLVVVGRGKNAKEHKVDSLSEAVKKAEAAPKGTKVELFEDYGGGEKGYFSSWSGKYGVFVYDA